MPRSKKTPKIVPDKDNQALHEMHWVETAPWSDEALGSVSLGSRRKVAAGIRSLVAEREMLRKLVKEAYMKGALDQSHNCGLIARARNWRASGIPEKLEQPERTIKKESRNASSR